MIRDVNPYDNTNNPNHFMHPPTQEQTHEIERIYNSIVNVASNAEIKPLMLALMRVLVDGFMTWRTNGVKNAEAELGEMSMQEKEDASDTVCYAQYVQFLTMMMHHMPTDMNKKILQTCLEAQSTREKYYFGHEGDIAI